MKLVTQMNAAEAKDFFLKHSSYSNFNLPSYFNFTDLLLNVDEALREKPRGAIDIGLPRARKFSRTSYTLQTNKDGHYAWRPFELIHPVLYVHLVNQLTEENNWQVLLDRFEQFSSNPNIVCASIPRESEEENISDTAESVHGWWVDVEQESISLAIDFKYVFFTDIANFYPSIYTHSIPWAIHTKEVAKLQRNRNDSLGNEIDNSIQDMRNGQTNGIPQGSVLMDFIAEIIMGYVDLSLGDRLRDSGIHDYKILRFRDDFRVFTNSKENAESIIRHLTIVLQELGLQLNSEKTFLSEDIVIDSIKPDKREALMIFGKNVSGTTIQKALLKLSLFSRKYKNSGQIERYLSSINRRVMKTKALKSSDNIAAMVSVLVDIMYHNPRVFASAALVLSTLFKFIEDDDKKLGIIDKIKNKFEPVLGTGMLDIWLQRVSFPVNQDVEYQETLCNVVSGAIDIPHEHVWYSEWITDQRFKNGVLATQFIVEETLAQASSIINEDEVVLFPYSSGEVVEQPEHEEG